MVDHKEKGLTSAATDPDVEMMLRVRDDDAVAFAGLVEKYQPRLFRVLRHMVGSDSVAEDLAQDVFLRVWRARKKYEPKAKFSTWLFHIAHNVASNSIRDRNRKKEYQVSSSSDDEPGSFGLSDLAMSSTGALPVRKLEKEERAEMVRLAVESLNERQRMALLLCKWEGQSYQDIADAMGLSVQAVKSLLSRARVNLKNILQPYVAAGSHLTEGAEADASKPNKESATNKLTSTPATSPHHKSDTAHTTQHGSPEQDSDKD